MKVIAINHKNKGKPHFIDINAYHHTIYPDASLSNYYTAQYKLCQTKIVNDQLYAVAINEGISILDRSISSLDQRRFKEKKRLYPAQQKIFQPVISIVDRPYLYRVEYWQALRDESRSYYRDIIEPLSQFMQINRSERLWYSDTLHDLLVKILRSHLNYMIESVQPDSMVENYYINIQPNIYSKTTRHMHGDRRDTHPISFDLYFTSNLYIPSLLSIGQAVSIGYGTIIEV